MSHSILLVVAAALMNEDGWILLAERPAGKSLAGFWEYPGGKVKEGETPERALVRELKEELGIEVEEKDLKPLAFASHDYPDFHLLMPLFVCRKWKGAPHPHEGQKLAWVKKEEMKNYPMPPADVMLAAALKKM